MKKSVFILSSVLGLSLALSACSDPKKASEANFKKAIQAALDSDNEAKFCFTEGRFPETENPYNKDRNNILQVLEKEGLLSSSMVEQKGFFGGEAKQIKQYDLAEAGKKFVLDNQFCVGKLEVIKVTNFTEPSDGLGQTVSQADYTYTIKDLPNWTKDPILQAAYPKSFGKLAKGEELEKKMNLVLTNNGWQGHIRKGGF
ncbi:MAG: hypothetical protein KA999_00800 [Acinetobacter sp.]|jgi:hypothetical protein|nr:hypothetical protein [Acinetobacter sp.]MBP7217442.1 hypothetical protein [Acinetobacter sp.]